MENNLQNNNKREKNAKIIDRIFSVKRKNIPVIPTKNESPSGGPADNTAPRRFDSLSRPQPVPRPELNNDIDQPDLPDEDIEDSGENEQFGQDLSNNTPAQNKERTHWASEGQQDEGANPPGGEAINPNKPETKNQNQESSEPATSNNAIRSSIDRGKEFGNKISSGAKELGNNLKSKFSKTALKAAWNLPQVRIAVLIIVAILLAIIIIVSIFAIFSNGSSPSATGKSAPQQVDPVADKEWINKVLMLTNDSEVTKTLTNEFLEKLKTDLTTLKAELSGNAELSTKIDNVLTIIDATTPLTGTERTKKATEIKNAIVAIAESLYSVVPVTIETTWPLAQNLFGGAVTFNFNSHIGTPGNPCGKGINNGQDVSCAKVKGKSARTFMQSMANSAAFSKPTNSCDAVDLKIPNGTPVYSVFAGKVVRKTSMEVRVESTINGKKYDAVYAHMSNTKKKDDVVNKGEQLGVVGEGHLHFEFAVNDHCVVLSPTETKSNQGKVGQALWAKMAVVLNLK